MQTVLNWRTALVSPSASIQSVIKNLEASSLQIVLVADDTHKLLGTITDGDIRRALLRGLNLDSSIIPVMQSDPLVCKPEMGRDIVMQLMRTHKLRQLPIIDSTGIVVGLHLWDDIFSPPARDNTVVIMAGGFGKRLLPHTENCPKPMLPVAGRPILEHILLRAISDGFRNYVISLHYLGEKITDYFGDGSQWGVNIKYVHEQTPLGTAGALSLIEPQPQSPIIVTNGDLLSEIRYADMLDFHHIHHAMATMAVRPYTWQHPFGVVKISDAKILGIEEKPVYKSHVNAGVYVLSPQVLLHLDRGKACDMPTLFERLRESNHITVAFPMHEEWMDVGRPEDLDHARLQMSS